MLLKLFLTSLMTLHAGCAGPLPTESKEESLNVDTSKFDFKQKPANYLFDKEKDIENERYLLRRQDDKRELPYNTDKWSYQPFIEYSNESPHSKSITQIAIGKSAVEALQKRKERQPNNQNIHYLPPVFSNHNMELQNVPSVYDDHASQPHLAYLPLEQDLVQEGIYVTKPPPQDAHSPYYSHDQYLPNLPHEHVIYITPQTSEIPYGTRIAPSYYQQDHMYVLTHEQAQLQNHPSEYSHNDQNDEKHYTETLHAIQNDGPNANNVDEEHSKLQKDMDKTEDNQLLVETSTAKAIIEEYEKHYVKKNVDVSTNGESGSTPNPFQLGTTSLSVTKPAPLSRQPIIVPDIDENNLEEDRIYSTTQNALKTIESTSVQRTTKPTMDTTTRSLSTNILAPITAGIQLQSVEELHPKQKETVIVEIQKSVPYYLGKFEYFQNSAVTEPTKNDEVHQNVDIGTSLLKYSIGHPPNLPASSSELNRTRPYIVEVPYSELQDQKKDSAQYEYSIQNGRQTFIQNVSNFENNQIFKPPAGEANHYKLSPAQNGNEKSVASDVIVDVDKSIPVFQETKQILIEQQRIPGMTIKTVSDYVQRPLYPQRMHFPQSALQILPLFQHKYVQQQDGVLLEPFAAVTKLIPQYIQHNFHQPAQKVQMKSYSYAPSYQINHQQHRHPKNGENKQNVPNVGQRNPQHNTQHISHAIHNSVRSNKPSSYNKAISPYPTSSRLNVMLNQQKGPPFKASQLLQTVHEQSSPGQLSQQEDRKYRNPRHSFGNTIRLEYGFMPPLIPSIEIDENGKPIEKSNDD